MSATNKVAIISKPGKPELATIIPHLLDWLRAHKYEALVDRETAAHLKGCEVVEREEIAKRKPGFVIVLGGDGTLRGVAQWAIDSEFESEKEMCARGELGKLPYPLLVVPMGTANLMGKHLGVKWNDENIGEEVVAALEHGRLAQLDVARTSGSGTTGERAGVANTRPDSRGSGQGA